jgi:multidrug efflux pump subunit AcrB
MRLPTRAPRSTWDIDEIENLTVEVVNGRPIRLKDFARVERQREPVFNVVTAESISPTARRPSWPRCNANCRPT